MKLIKTQVCLYLYETLLETGQIDSVEFKNKFELNDKTLFRYISEIRCYLSNFYKGKELVYSREENKYYLIPEGKIINS